MIIIPGSSNPKLARSIARHLAAKVANLELSKFPNGEKRVWVKSNLAGDTVAIVQSFSEPVDEHIIEFSLLADAAKHLGASSILAVVPWFGYSPQDKSFRKGEPVSAHVVARIIECVGTSAFITVDIHSKNILNFFTIPTLEVSARPLFVDYFKTKLPEDAVIVSLDAGSRARARHIARDLNLPLCSFDKTRDRHSGAIKLAHVSGDVKGKTAISFDDFVSTGSTRIAASRILKSLGAHKYIDCITHPLLAGDSSAKLAASSIDQIITTDTYPIPKEKHISKLKIVSSAALISQAITKLTQPHPQAKITRATKKG